MMDPQLSEAMPMAGGAAPSPAPRASRMAEGLQGPAILRIAAQVRARIAAGVPVANFTVGDFSPAEFPAPATLLRGVSAALQRGETNYPPSSGMPELRAAIGRFYQDRLGVTWPVEGILTAAGARPGIYAAYRAVVDPGDRVVFPLPSWNNFDYCHLVGAEAVPVPCDASLAFLPTRDRLEPHLAGARLLVLNSPQNPAGTVFDGETLAGICDLVLDENARREARGERPLYLLYDQVYWMLTLGGVRHVHPLGVRPAMAPYTIYVDAISKSFAATGLRVGWMCGPTDVIARMNDICGHAGAWAPRAEQLATAALLDDAAAVDAYHETMIAAIRRRLEALHRHLRALREAGLPVEAIRPTATIYLSARLALRGRMAPSGTRLDTDEAVRTYLLEQAGFAVVPFRAFGVPGDDGWFRLSVGAVSVADIDAVMPRLRGAIEATRPAEQR